MKTARPAGRRSQQTGWLCALGIGGLLAVVLCAGLVRGQSQATFSLPAIDLPKTTNAPGQATQTIADTPQKKEVAKEADDLLKMAMDLKSEVDKTTKDTLSVSVVRKAGEIEQMAHKVRAGSGKG